jgi:hypothetical protein
MNINGKTVSKAYYNGQEITSAFFNGEQQLESPSFTSGLSFEVNRASEKYVIDSERNYSTIPSNTIMEDYLEGKFQYLIEDSITNQIKYSNQFNIDGFQAWIKQFCTVQSGFLAPDNTNTAWKLIPDTLSTPNHRIREDRTAFTTVSKAGVSTAIIHAKAGEYSKIAIGDTGTNSRTVAVDLTNGKVLTNDFGTDDKVSVIPLSNGWYRIEIIFDYENALIPVNYPLGGSYYLTFQPLDDSYTPGQTMGLAPAYSGNDSDGLYIWECSGYIGKYANSLTKNNNTGGVSLQDVATLTLDNVNIGATEGVLNAAIQANSNDLTNRLITVNDGSANNQVSLGYSSLGTNTIVASLISNGVLQKTITKRMFEIVQEYNVAVRYGNGAFSLWINGEMVEEDLTVSNPIGLNKVDLKDGAGNNSFYGRISRLKYYDTAQSDIQMQNISKKLYNDEYENLDLFLELGQSNMGGEDGDLANPNYPFSSKNGYYFDGFNQFDITTDRGYAEGKGSQANYFCEQYFSLTGRKAVMGENSHSASGLTAESSFPNWGGDSTRPYRMQTEILAYRMLKFYRKESLKILWCQGERDAGEMFTDPLYTEAIVKVAMQDVVDWGLNLANGDIDFIISQTGGRNDGSEETGFVKIRNIQDEMETENLRVHVASRQAKDFPSLGFMSDNIHYDFRGYKVMGEDFANYIFTNIL